MALKRINKVRAGGRAGGSDADLGGSLEKKLLLRDFRLQFRRRRRGAIGPQGGAQEERVGRFVAGLGP